MTTEEKYDVARKTIRWLQLRAKHEKRVSEMSLDEFLLVAGGPDLDHSSLWARMVIHDKEPLEFPPPRACSYPWYSLIENGEDTVPDFLVNFGGFGKLPHEVVFINQAPWDIVEILPDSTGYIVRWDEDNPLFVLTPDVYEVKAFPKDEPMRTELRSGWKMIVKP